MIQPRNILISRTDSIGDVVLTLPLAGIIKEHFPESKVFFLGRNYTKSIIGLSSFVDEVIVWDELEKLSEERILSFLKERNIDCFIHVFPNKRIARLVKKAGIKNRIGTSHRIYHFTTCNIRPDFTRKNSELHEAQLNVKLLAPLGITEIPPVEKMNEYYGIKPVDSSGKTNPLIDKTRFNLILHPKSKGSAREWGSDNFSGLIELLPADKYKIFISGTKEEGELIKDLLNKHKEKVTDITGKFTLEEFIRFIGMCNGLVAASTGPLHIAAALGIKAIGIYPPIRPMHPGRWAPIGKHAHVLVADKECSDCRKTGDCQCMRNITPEEVIEILQPITRFS